MSLKTNTSSLQSRYEYIRTCLIFRIFLCNYECSLLFLPDARNNSQQCPNSIPFKKQMDEYLHEKVQSPFSGIHNYWPVIQWIYFLWFYEYLMFQSLYLNLFILFVSGEWLCMCIDATGQPLMSFLRSHLPWLWDKVSHWLRADLLG